MKRILMILVPALILAAGLTVFLIVYNQPGFTGDRVANPDSYTLIIECMNGDDRHTMELAAGDVLEVQMEAAEGSLRLEITSPDGSVLYSGNGKEAQNFTLNIPERGAYSVAVEARRAKGTIYLQRKEQPS